MFTTIVALWNAASWIRAEKKILESNAEAYLTEERAKEWRLQAEKIFWALETGNGNEEHIFFSRLPRIVKWFFGATKADNHLGHFGKHFLKSEKLENGDGDLEQPLYQTH